MISMARGLRLGNMYSTRKRKRSNYYDDDSLLLEKVKQKQQQQLKRSKKNKLGRRRRGFRLRKCSTGLTKQQLEEEEDGSSSKKNTLGRRGGGFRLRKCSTALTKQQLEDGSSSKEKQISLSSKKRKHHHNKPEEEEEEDKQQEEDEEAHVEPREQLKNGDILNLSDILFTKERDFLITYNDRNRPVQAKHLEGKVIVLHFVPLVPWNDYLKLHVTSLVDIYHALHPKGGFEVVFIGLKYGKFASNPQKLLKYFEQKFSIMPWPAVPFSDVKTDEYFIKRLGFPSALVDHPFTSSVVIDPTGVVLQYRADDDFIWFGAEAYPFSDQRLDCIISQDKEALKHPSITTLLTSPERNYVINNDNQVVPVHTLEDKVVGLYFYNDYYSNDFFTPKLMTAYEQLAKEGNFEIVLVYIHNSFASLERVSEESYWTGFHNMPWLALPFKDPKCISLQRVFNLPCETMGSWPDSSLVIIGPQGKFVEPYGADILKKFGISAYPFTRKRVAQLEAGYIKKLKLDMFWNPNTSFIQKNGLKVKLSQLFGKRIIVIIKGIWVREDPKFWRKLKARYLQMKGTKDEFEVVHICEKQGSSYGEHVVANMSWLRHPPIGEDSNIFKLVSRLFGDSGGLLAFDRDGRVVRSTKFPSIERGNMNFPFHADGLEKDALRELIIKYDWDYWLG